MSRVYNFSAGPAVLPEEVLKEAAAEMLDYKGCGMSVMEMSHRSSVFQEIIETAEADIRDLMQIPDNYKVLFLQGGASQQFAMIPMNLMKNKVADYIVTGQWAKKAAKEAEKYGEVHVVASSEDKTFSYIPDCSDLEISEDADYVYICENNTIYGTKFKELPDTKGKTLVADVSFRDMFRLMTEFGFDFIINSQVLWGDCDTLDALAIYQLIRPGNAKFVTVMPYLWNGKKKELLEREEEVEQRGAEIGQQ